MNELTVPVLFSKDELYIIQHFIKARFPHDERMAAFIVNKELSDKVAFAIGSWDAPQKTARIFLAEAEAVDIDVYISAVIASKVGESIVDKLSKARLELAIKQGIDIEQLREKYQWEVAEYVSLDSNGIPSGGPNTDTNPDADTRPDSIP